MRVIILLSSILVVNAGVLKEDCIQNEEEVLHTDLDRPYLLTVDHSCNTLYFSHSQKDDKSKTAQIDLNTKEFKNIKGINNGFAQTVDEKTHDIYIGGSDGIYKYDSINDRAEHIGLNTTNIWNIYFKDVLYFIEFPTQFIYTFKNGVAKPFEDLEGTKVDNFIIDNNNTMYFTFTELLFKQEKGTKFSLNNHFKSFPDLGVRGLAMDLNGKIHICVRDGIYAENDEKNGVDKVLDVDDAFGLAFDINNNIVYSDSSRVVRVKANKHCKTE